ncbi:unnamed protein product [Microthlaspi erraticum]|uniref:Uncharacterized protein n=1 Tax=Microthlaspi erraticum TaxID=1685480 RepID=A0A6D2JHS8_9BRAS|nr:unnamed protein product [Microthlaspi erraticum]
MEPKPFSQSRRDIELLEWDEIVLDQSNGQIKWNYTAASRTDQSNGAIQMLNQGVSGQSGRDTQQMREGANNKKPLIP